MRQNSKQSASPRRLRDCLDSRFTGGVSIVTPFGIFIPELLTMDGAPRPDVFINYSTKDELIAPADPSDLLDF